MSQYIKTVKFSGTLQEFEYSRNKPTRAFLKDVVSTDGLIRKSFYWLERNTRQLEQLKKGQQVNFIIKY